MAHLYTNMYYFNMFIAIPIKHCAYFTSTTMLLFYAVTTEIDALILSMNERINTLLEECGVKQLSLPLHFCNHNVMYMEPFPG